MLANRATPKMMQRYVELVQCKSIMDESIPGDLLTGLIDNYTVEPRSGSERFLPRIKNRWSLLKFENRIGETTRLWNATISDRNANAVKKRAKECFLSY